ncbi:MAG: hypothetical protein ABIQ74_08845, partial [Chitinophagales bacterium]
MKYFTISLTLIIILFANKVNAGSPVKAGWSIRNPFEQKVFIENQGQFEGMNNRSESAIQYAVDDGGANIFFTTRGITYRFDNTGNKLSPDAEKKDTERKNTA